MLTRILALALTVALAATLTLTACGGGGDAPINAAQAQAQPQLPLCVGFGDSVMAGYMPDSPALITLQQSKAFPAELAPLCRFTTAAVGGATTAAMVAGQLAWMSPLEPDVVVVLSGINDAGQRLPREAALANVATLVDRWKTARVVIVAPPRWDAPTDAWLAAWRDDLRTLAQRRGARFVDAYAASQASPWQCSQADFHPCEPAHRELGRLVAGAVREALASRAPAP